MPENIKCRKCEAKLLAPIRHLNFDALKVIKKFLKRSTLTSDERKKYDQLKQRGDLYLVYRNKSAQALAGRGIGSQTAKRILAKYHKTDDDLFRDILQAERDFIRTKKYWKL
jgi:ATP-dependent Lhr-like helicase